jgi:uncharacterized protein YgiM (DUF1202 family)
VRSQNLATLACAATLVTLLAGCSDGDATPSTGEPVPTSATSEAASGVGADRVYLVGNTQVGLALRRAAGATEELLERLPAGTPLRTLGGHQQAGGVAWVEVTTDDGLTGWVAYSYLVTPEAAETAVVAVTGSAIVTGVSLGVNVRAEPGGAIIGGVAADTSVLLTGRTEGEWTEISYEDRPAWIPTSALAPSERIAEPAAAPSVVTEQMTVIDIVNGLNIRSGPSLDASIIGGIPNGEIVQTTGATEGEWVEIEYANVVGWVSGEHLLGDR